MIYVLIGCPGSGKSTFIKNKARAIDKVISSDSIRAELWGSVTIQKNPAAVFDVAYGRLITAVSRGVDVYFDATNIKKRDRKTVLAIAKAFGVDVVAVVMNVPYEICCKRNSKRDRKVPEEVIARMAKNFEYPTLEEGFSKIIEINS